MKKLSPAQGRFLTIASLLFVAFFAAGLYFFTKGGLAISLLVGLAFAFGLFLFIYFIVLSKKIDRRLYNRKNLDSSGWINVNAPMSIFIVGLLSAPVFEALSPIAVISLYFAIFSDEAMFAKLFAIAILGSAAIMLPWLSVTGALTAYRFLFVKTRYDEARIERRGPIGRGRSFTFRQIHSAGWNSVLSHVWIRSVDGDRIVISCSDFGAYDLYTRLRTELGPRYAGKPWPAERNPHRAQPG